MPSYAAPKHKPVKFRGKRQALNPAWLTRAARGAALMKAMLPHFDEAEKWHAHQAIDLMETIDMRSTNITARKQLKAAEHHIMVAMGLASPTVG